MKSQFIPYHSRELTANKGSKRLAECVFEKLIEMQMLFEVKFDSPLDIVTTCYLVSSIDSHYTKALTPGCSAVQKQ